MSLSRCSNFGVGSPELWVMNCRAISPKARDGKPRPKASTPVAGMGVALIGAPLVRLRGEAICYHRAMPPQRRFPPPWSIDERTKSFIVKDATGQTLAYAYFGRPQRAMSMRRISRDEARRIAVNSPSCQTCYAGNRTCQRTPLRS